MSTQIIGKVTINPCGNYNSSTQYSILDLVTYGGSSYLAKKNVKNITPENNNYWQLVSVGGANAPQLTNGILSWPSN